MGPGMGPLELIGCDGAFAVASDKEASKFSHRASREEMSFPVLILGRASLRIKLNQK